MKGGFLIALLIALSLPATGDGQQRKAKPKQGKINTVIQSTASPTPIARTPTAQPTFTVVFTPQGKPTSPPQATATKPEPYWSRNVFWPPNWSDWAVVFIAGITAFIGLRTLKALLRQTKAADDSAKAAQQSANAAQRSAEAADRSATAASDSIRHAKEALSLEQRPWIVTSGVITREASHVTNQEVVFELRVANNGKTPALNMRTRVKYVETDIEDAAPTGEGLFGDESATVVATSTMGPGVKQIIEGAVPVEVYLRAQNEKKLWLLGLIEYGDIFDCRHVTKFSFRLHLAVLDPDVWDQTGPHNDCT